MMRSGIRPIGLAAAAIAIWAATAAAEQPIRVVAAQPVYAEVARAVGGDRVAVDSLIASPDQDPHLFEPTPAAARLLAEADIVLANGAGYDPWVADLLEASPKDGRIVIEAAGLVGAGDGDNPHLWYDPATVPALAHALAAELARRDAGAADAFEERLAGYLASLQPLAARIAEMRAAHAGLRVAATEPVFGPMAAALGLVVVGEDVQRAIMNETEPSARALAALEDELRNRRIAALIVNRQIGEAFSMRLAAIARAAGVPVVEVTEMPPAERGYREWMLAQLEALAAALDGSAA